VFEVDTMVLCSPGYSLFHGIGCIAVIDRGIDTCAVMSLVKNGF